MSSVHRTMSSHHPNHPSNITARVARQEELVNSARNQNPDELIKQVHDRAMRQYHHTKKEKQHELASRIEEARRSGDKAIFKNAKKKVDNHASSVASRARRGYLIHNFEDVVRTTIEEKKQLAETMLHQEVVHKLALAKKDTELHSMQQRIDKLMKEIDSLKASISKTRSNAKSPSIQTTRESTWNPTSYPMDSIDTRGTEASASEQAHIDHFNEMDRNDMDLELDEDGSGILAMVSSPGVAEEPSLKMDGDWGPMAISPTVQARIKADNHEDVFAPAL